MKILISGGGIAGNVLAFWLSRLGHDITVVERFESLRATGLQIDLRGHGIEVLKRMGLEQAFRAKSAPEQGWQLVDSAGRRRAYFPANKSGKGLQSFTSDFEIMRGDLVALLQQAAANQNQNQNQGHPVKYVFGTSIARFEETGEAVDVVFADGTAGRFDLLVGADGQWSRTRRMMLGPDTADALRPLPDTYIGYFTAPQPIQPGEPYQATMYMAPGRRGVMVRRHDPATVQVYLACTSASPTLRAARRGDVDAEKRGLASVFRGAGWRVDALLDAMHAASDFYCERLGLVDLPRWSSPTGARVVLVGDAAYCPTANTGMGTTAAVVGAYVLAGEIGRCCGRPARHEEQEGGDGDGDGNDDDDTARGGLAAALRGYERVFRPFVTQVQKGVLEDKGFMPETALGIAIFHLVIGVASFLRVDISGWALKEKVRNWQLPDYEELTKALD